MKARGAFLASVIAAFFVLTILAAAAFAVPQTINYQGYIEGSGGTPVNGTLSMTFSIYNAPTGGSALWTETQSTVSVTDGAFSVVMGSLTPINLPFDEQYYLGVQVGADAEMTPRAVLVSVPYAMRAGAADTAVTLGDKTLSDLVTLLDSRYGNLGDSLVANFTADDNNIYTNQTVNFTDISQGVPTLWNWDFGDSGTSTLQNPSNTYTAPGIYTVSLTVGDGITSSTETKIDYVNILEIVPQFNAYPTAPALDETVNFTDLTQGVPISWSWDFGDSGTSTAQNPSHAYSAGGTYTVSLTVDDGTSVKTLTRTDLINVYPFYRGTRTTVDSSGYYISMVIGADGLPIMVYYDNTQADLKVAHCGDVSCSAGNTITTVDSTDSKGQYPSIVIGADDLPVISYLDNTNYDLKVLHCGNALCSSGNSIATVDSTGNVGFYTSIAIGSDDLPIISYFDATNQDLKVAHCGDASCSSGNDIVTVDSSGSVGHYTAMAIGADGMPVISYYGSTPSFDLKVAHCGIANCSSGNTITSADYVGGVTSYTDTSIAIGSDDLPVVSYYDYVNKDLKVLHCGIANCSTSNIATVDSTGDIGQYPSMAVGPDGNPVVAYFDASNGRLRLVMCGDSACSTGNSIRNLDITGSVGYFTSIAIGSDDLPVVSYHDNTNQTLKVTHCGDAECTLF